MKALWAKMNSVNLIEDKDLREKVIKCWETAVERSVFNAEEVSELGFTLLIPDCPADLLVHTESVATGAYNLAKHLMTLNPMFDFDLDILLAGGLLHDVGKVLEYDKVDGKVVKGQYGKYLRHPFSGMALAHEFGLPAHIQHIIAMHAKEGNLSPRTKEANLIHKMDFINFETYKIILGMM